MKKIAVAALLVFGAVATAHAAGDPNAGKEKSASCAACHNKDGNSVAPNFPKIAGQHAGYTTKQLMDFKSGDRQNATMAGMVAGLSKKDMEDLAAYFATQEMTIGTANEDLVALGEEIYRAGNEGTGVAACMACHGPNGAGNPAANFPRLGGQHAQYTETQLKAFRAGERANDPGQMMRNIASKMTDEEIKAVSSYIEGLH